MLGTSRRARTRSLAVAGGAALMLGWVAGVAPAGDLPDHRGYELVSPGDKLGNDIVGDSSRTHAAASDAPGLPAALMFTSLGGFGDVQGSGIATEYLAERDGLSGSSGWQTHAVTPRQDPLTLLAISGASAEPAYVGDLSSDLTRGVFQSWSPVTDAPNVEHVQNLYVREDLRTPGAGFYRLITDATSPLPAPDPANGLPASSPLLAGATQDFQHVLFESNYDLTNDATGRYVKLYKTDGTATRLVDAGFGCPGGAVSSPAVPDQCSAAGLGAKALHYTPRVLSSDGSRTEFTAPVTTTGGAGGVVTGAGVPSKLFQLDDRGTPSNADDAVIQLNTSEKASPDVAQAASYQTGSVDGSRVFFISGEQLTDAPSGGLYMWQRQPTDEAQAVAVDATGGAFKLTFHSQVSTGSGTLASGSNVVTGVAGSFAVGETVDGLGIPAGTTIVGMGRFNRASTSTLTLSANATASGAQVIRGSVDATTAALPSNATAAEVQSALEELSNVGTGNVAVAGGPGGEGGTTPYLVTFTGAYAGVDVAQLSADGGALTGGAATATVTTTRPLRNLSLIAAFALDRNDGVIGASEDGHRLYLVAAGPQLVNGASALTDRNVYYWQDADGTPGGTLSWVGGVAANDVPPIINNSTASTNPTVSRVTPDGRALAFEVSDGSFLSPGYDQLGCIGREPNANDNGSGGCSEVYVYRADGSTPTVPNLVCASCNPTGAPATRSAWINYRIGASATKATSHLSHALSDDGQRVFFSTAEALVPEDTNGRIDAYEYDVPTGTVHLISSGLSASDSYFMDASASGGDVYFLTREPLVGWDTDTNYDMYDARVDGGFPEPSPVAAGCSGDACQGAAPGVPAPPLLGSAAFRGAGDARATLKRRTAPLRCRHGQVKRRVKGRLRCVRRATAKHAKSHGKAKRPSRHAAPKRRTK